MTYLLLIASLLLSGCAELIIEPSDSVLTTTGKVAVRTLAFLPTFGISEFRMRDIKGEQDCDLRGGWYFMGACRANTQENRDRAMMLAPLIMQNTWQGVNAMQQPLRHQPSCQNIATSYTTSQTVCY